MGYHEPFCQLCGVGFAIARLRRADEPKEAGWDSTGSDYVEIYDSDATGIGMDVLCEERSGCTVSDRGGDRPGEHLAGPGCVSHSGYSGHRISLAEMKGCRAIQCLVKKNANWTPEDDDQDFELEGDYFLSGIGEGSPDMTPLEDIKPVRHGVERIYINNIGDWSEIGLPFHPTCFEIYKEVCKMRNGRIDTEGLFCSRFLDSDYGAFLLEKFDDPAVLRGNGRWWRHEPGCEYLVANPIEVPDLSHIIQHPVDNFGNKITLGNAERSDNSQTQSHRTSPSTSKSIQDPFSQLSTEITCMILDYLGSKDIANLRLATTVFRQLPTILFRRLLLEDMPWLFEVKNLDVAKMNWYDCYCAINSGCRDLKGLRNRRRIWRDVEELIRRIQVYRSEGKVGTPNDWAYFTRRSSRLPRGPRRLSTGGKFGNRVNT